MMADDSLKLDGHGIVHVVQDELGRVPGGELLLQSLVSDIVLQQDGLCTSSVCISIIQHGSRARLTHHWHHVHSEELPPEVN